MSKAKALLGVLGTVLIVLNRTKMDLKLQYRDKQRIKAGKVLQPGWSCAITKTKQPVKIGGGRNTQYIGVFQTTIGTAAIVTSIVAIIEAIKD